MSSPNRPSLSARRPLATVAVGVLAVGLLSALSPSTAAAAPAGSGAPALLRDAGAPAAAPASARASRARTVTLAPAVLPETLPPAAAPARVGFDLFADVSFDGVVTGVEHTRDTTSWSGTVTGGYFYAARADSVYVVHVATRAGVYEVSSIGGSSRYRVIQIDPRKMAEPLGDVSLPATTTAPTSAASSTADARGRYDVLVGYTTAALAAEGGSVAAMRARIALAIAETNGGYRNSGVTTSVRLVHQQALNYVEAADIQDDVDTLADPDDGVNDTMPALRDTYGADVAVMLVDRTRECGRARQIGATAATAYAVVVIGCATGNYSFGHEIGHLQGARHDAYVDPDSTPYAYGHGYVDVAAGWRTIMAYNQECADAGTDCTRLQYWSDPDVRYQNRPTGTAAARNADVLNATAATVANFRAQVVGDDVTSTFTSGADGWTRVSGGWTAANGQVSSPGVTDKGSSMTRPFKYTDFTMSVRMRRTGDVASANRVIIRGAPGRLDDTNLWLPSYLFQYTNSGSVSVFALDASGLATTLLDWTVSGAVRGGDWNDLTVIASGSTLRFVVNGSTVYSSAVPGRPRPTGPPIGRVGFGFYRDQAGALAVDSVSIRVGPTAGGGAAPAPATALPAPTARGDVNTAR